MSCPGQGIFEYAIFKSEKTAVKDNTIFIIFYILKLFTIVFFFLNRREYDINKLELLKCCLTLMKFSF